MGLEGAVRLGYRRELDAIDDPAQREESFEAMVSAAYGHGKALNVASAFEIDDVIDPADTRRWITTLLTGPTGLVTDHTGKKRPFVDTWRKGTAVITPSEQS